MCTTRPASKDAISLARAAALSFAVQQRNMRSSPPPGLVEGWLEQGWVLLLGDSLTRHVFLELYTTLCSNGNTEQAQSTTHADYHNARTFCMYERHGACEYVVSPRRTQQGAANATAEFQPRCPQQMVNYAFGRTKPPQLCVTFDWAPLWEDVLAELKLVKSACGEAPSSLVTNPGLHELLDAHLHVASARDMMRVRRDVGWRLKSIISELARGRGGTLTTLVVQSATSVESSQFPTRKIHERGLLNNRRIELYNAAVDLVTRRQTAYAASLGVCLTRTDGFALTTRNRDVLNGTIDGIHWRPPFDRLMLDADLEHLDCRLDWHKKAERHSLKHEATRASRPRRGANSGRAWRNARRSGGRAAQQPLEASQASDVLDDPYF